LPLLPKYFGIQLAMQSMSDSLNGGFSFLRNLISLLLANFLLQSTIKGSVVFLSSLSAPRHPCLAKQKAGAAFKGYAG
jgi:hypothetical protein